MSGMMPSRLREHCGLRMASSTARHMLLCCLVRADLQVLSLVQQLEERCRVQPRVQLAGVAELDGGEGVWQLVLSRQSYAKHRHFWLVAPSLQRPLLGPLQLQKST